MSNTVLDINNYWNNTKTVILYENIILTTEG